MIAGSEEGGVWDAIVQKGQVGDILEFELG
jgi:hypothetical protein